MKLQKPLAKDKDAVIKIIEKVKGVVVSQTYVGDQSVSRLKLKLASDRKDVRNVVSR